MKLTIRHHHLPSSHALDSLVESRLFTLDALVTIEDASVLLEHRVEASPAYRAEIRVTIPGPDLASEAVDHTAANAFRRAAAELEDKLRERASRRERRSNGRDGNSGGFRMGKCSR